MPKPRHRSSDFRRAPHTEPIVKVPTDSVFTIDDLVVYLKLPKSTVYKLAQEGKIPGQKVGRHWRFHKTAIDHWLGGRQMSKGEADGAT